MTTAAAAPIPRPLVDAVLARAAQAGNDPDHSTLAALGDELAPIGEDLDLPAVLQLVVVGDYAPERPRVELELELASAQWPSLIAAFIDAYRREDADAVAALDRDDVTLDANVPQWPFAIHGPHAVADLLRVEEYKPGLEVAGWRASPTADGATVEIECHYGDTDHQRLVREVHLLRLNGVGIAEHALYCSGIWDTATVERYRATECR